MSVLSEFFTSLPKYVVVKDMNYEGEEMTGEFDGTYYVLDDGDCYLPETLRKHYNAKFFDVKPCFKL